MHCKAGVTRMRCIPLGKNKNKTYGITFPPQLFAYPGVSSKLKVRDMVFLQLLAVVSLFYDLPIGVTQRISPIVINLVDDVGAEPLGTKILSMLLD